MAFFQVIVARAPAKIRVHRSVLLRMHRIMIIYCLKLSEMMQTVARNINIYWSGLILIKNKLLPMFKYIV